MLASEIRNLDSNPTWIEFAINPSSIREHLSRVSCNEIKGPSGEELIVQFIRKAEGYDSAVDSMASAAPNSGE